MKLHHDSYSRKTLIIYHCLINCYCEIDQPPYNRHLLTIWSGYANFILFLLFILDSFRGLCGQQNICQHNNQIGFTEDENYRQLYCK